MNKVLEVLRETVTAPLRTTVIADQDERADEARHIRKSSPSPSAGTPAAPDATVVSRNFKLVFLCVLAISIFALGAQVWIVFAQGDQMGVAAKDLVSYLRTIATAGTGTIFGLVGGKVA